MAALHRRNNWLVHVFVILLGLLMMYPIAWLISSSLKPSDLIFTDTSTSSRPCVVPAVPSAWAMPLPMPRLAPVISAIVPLSGSIVL